MTFRTGEEIPERELAGPGRYFAKNQFASDWSSFLERMRVSMIKHSIKDRLGLVSNCWKKQLEAGESLWDLIDRATVSGFSFVELRQGCLGEFEEKGSRLPRGELLEGLAREFPHVTFDLAVELPLFSEEIDPASCEIRVLLEAARALGDEPRPAHLRIVDLVSRCVPSSSLEDSQTSVDFTQQQVMESLLGLQDELPSGVLSLEHSFQPWIGFRHLFSSARSTADSGGSKTPSLKLCYDPCNLWLSGDDDLLKEPGSLLNVDWLSMVHLKQRVDGNVSTRLEPGHVDWIQQLMVLDEAGYAGPLLFETAPSADVWECLTDSCKYLGELISMLPLDARSANAED